MVKTQPVSENAPGKNSVERKVAELTATTSGALPEWVRAPKRGPERHTGLSRATLYRLVADGLIRSVAIRKPHSIRGIRLFNLPSILRFIASHAIDEGGKE